MYLRLKIMPFIKEKTSAMCVCHIVAQLPLYNMTYADSCLVTSILIIIVMLVNMFDVSYDIA